MIDRQHGKIVIICDRCDDYWSGNEGEEFLDVLARARRDGWQAQRLGLNWIHTCADCANKDDEG